MRGHAHRDVVASRRPISDDRAIHLFITARRAARLFLSTGLRRRSADCGRRTNSFAERDPQQTGDRRTVRFAEYERIRQKTSKNLPNTPGNVTYGFLFYLFIL